MDPSRTLSLRQKFVAELRRRMARVKRKIHELVVEEDAFGLKRRPDLLASILVGNRRWTFRSDPEKLREFERWLGQTIDKEVLADVTIDTADNGYWRAFVEEGYRKGQGRAFSDVIRPSLQANLDFFEGTREEFLRQAFGRPVAIDKVKLLSSRVFTDLKGVSRAMETGITRELAEGLTRGENPAVIARRMADRVDAIGRHRATLIARTEIIRSHAEGQLDAFDALGVTEVGVMVEWSTAGDDRVCFPAGTLIEADGKSISIEDIVIGTKVHTRNGLQRVIGIQSREYSENLVAMTVIRRDTVTTKDGPQREGRAFVESHYATLVATSDHPIWRDSGLDGPGAWIKADALNQGDRLCSYSKLKVYVSEIHTFPLGSAFSTKPIVVYNIQVENHPEFYAHGILVHNCPLCQPLEGVVMKIKEARGLIPRHVQCRCSFLPANVGEDPKKPTRVNFTDPKTGEVVTKHIAQTRSRGGIRSAVDRSIRAEIPKRTKRTLAQQKALSRWVGADEKFKTKRPKRFKVSSGLTRAEQTEVFQLRREQTVLAKRVRADLATPGEVARLKASRTELARLQRKEKKS
jgi:hypothetical protein